MSRHHGVLLAMRLTLRAVLRDTGVLLLLVVAGVAYAFFYPLPYAHEEVTRVPVAIVDGDPGPLTRQLVRFAKASPKLDVRLVTGDENEAREALWRREVEGLLIVPRGLHADVYRGRAVTLPVMGNGAYLLLNKTVLQGFAEVVGTLSAGIEIARRQAGGATPAMAALQRAPVRVAPHSLFNTRDGYASYIVPAVSVLIVQQTVVISAAMLVGTWAERGRSRLRWLARPRNGLGLLATLSAFGTLTGLFWFGFVFWFWDLPRGGNPWGAAALLPMFCLASAAMGVALGAWAGRRERVFMLWVPTSLPLMFLSGVPWPVASIPAPLNVLAAAFPSSPGILAFVRLNQQGASLADVAPLGGHLMVLCGSYLVLAAAVAARRGRTPP